MWLKYEGFIDRVQQWWTSYQFQGTPSYIMACKLKALENNLKSWNEQVFGNVEGQMKQLLEELKGLENIMKVREISEVERARKTQVSIELEWVSLMEEISWRQKSRTL